MKININKKNTSKRVDTFIAEVLNEKKEIFLTRSIIQKYIEYGCKINNEVCKKSYKLKEGDTLFIDESYWDSIKRDLDLSEKILPQKGELDIRYEDDKLLVLYKPKGLVVHPGVGNRDGTLANYIRFYLESKNEYDSLIDRCGLVHRLDKGVSGLMVVAKNKRTQEYLKGQFKNKRVIKIYYAYLDKSNKLVQRKDLKKYLEKLNIKLQPWLKWEKIEGYIGRSRENRYKMKFKTYEFSGSKYALSYILFSKNKALIKIETGRMHQIRATLEYLGYQIKGDCLYGSTIGQGDKIMLEAVLLSFINEMGDRITLKV